MIMLQSSAWEATHLFPDARDERFLFSIVIQRWHLARGEHVVDQLQESLVCNMGICEEKHDLQEAAEYFSKPAGHTTGQRGRHPSGV